MPIPKVGWLVPKAPILVSGPQQTPPHFNLLRSRDLQMGRTVAVGTRISLRPVGAYDPSRLSNLGIGHDAIDSGAFVHSSSMNVATVSLGKASRIER
jgi:hypothetical protein